MTTQTPLSAARERLCAVTIAGNPTFGGGTSDAASDVAEQYNPAGVLTQLTELSVPRSVHAATYNGNGNGMFAGGFSTIWQDTNNTIDSYNPAGVLTMQLMSEPRRFHAAATDGDGNSWFGGGFAPLNTTDTIDRISPAGVLTTFLMSEGRWAPVAANIGNGNVLFAGGEDNARQTLGTVDCFTAAGVLTQLEELSQARSHATAETDGNGNAIIAGGGVWTSPTTHPVNSVDLYTSTGLQMAVPPMSQSRILLAASKVGQGDVLFGGGTHLLAGDIAVSLDLVERHTT